MKKWIYLLIPGVMLAVFLVFFKSHEKEAIVREQARKKVLEDNTAKAQKEKEISEENARKSAKIAQQEREEKEAKKEADRRAKQAAIDREIKETTDSALAESDKLIKQAKQLETELDRLRKEKHRLGDEAFALAKKVEQAMVAKRNAELEQQRLTKMIAQKADQSSMTSMPPPVVVPPAGTQPRRG